MKKRVYRYFFDFLDGQTEWLNRMAARGWRLVKCGQLFYEFESCTPGGYEYAVEFVAGRAYSESKDYRAFLEDMGYRTFYKNINVGVAVGKVKFRPWAEGKGKIVTAPGGYFKELLIVEKEFDGKPFDLHTDLTDKLSLYKTVQRSCVWAVGGMWAFAVLFFSLAVVYLTHSFNSLPVAYALAGILFAVLGILLAKPLRGVSAKIRKWEEEAETNEYQPMRKRKRALQIIMMVCAAALISGFVFLFADGGVTVSSGHMINYAADSGSDYWGARYGELNGFQQRKVNLEEGIHTFTVEIVTNSGEVGFSLKGEDGTEYYIGSDLPTSSFDVMVEGKGRFAMRIDADKHSGSYKISWG
jgi:hypothetical protein